MSRPAAPSLFWLLPLALTAAQWWMSDVSRHQIRYEELAESLRSVFWFDHRLVYDGVYTNVGWYAPLLVVYKLFGYSLFGAKYVKLAVHALALLAAAAVLVRYMPWRVAIVPLAVIGLSPTLLYFDAMQTSFGLDLSYFAICLWLLLGVSPHAWSARDAVRAFLCGLVAMIAAMSYPVFLMYLPSLLLVGIWHIRASRLRYALVAAAGFALPLVAVCLWLKSPGQLYFDPETQAGLFRGGGKFGFDPVLASESIRAVLADLFVRGRSYYFEVTQPDLAGPAAAGAIVVVAATTAFLILTRRIDRLIALAIVLLVAASFIVPALSTEGPPGIRRATGLVAAWFVVFAMTWRFHTVTGPSRAWLRYAALAACVMFPISHAVKLPSLVRDLETPSTYRNADWFAAAGSPEASLEMLVKSVETGEPISCPRDTDGRVLPCRYQEVYPAITGYRAWNGLPPFPVRAMDWRTGREITLDIALWTSHYYPTCTRREACR
jgi:hypothetical protein